MALVDKNGIANIMRYGSNKILRVESGVMASAGHVLVHF